MSSQINFHHSGHKNIPFSLFSTSLHLVLLHLQLYSNDFCFMSDNQSFIHLLIQAFTKCLLCARNYARHCGEKDKNGTISVFKKLTQKICREHSAIKSMGFAELELEMILAFKIFVLWASEDTHCKKCEGCQCCVTVLHPLLPRDKALSLTLHPCPPPSQHLVSVTSCSCSIRWTGLALCWAKLQIPMFLL